MKVYVYPYEKRNTEALKRAREKMAGAGYEYVGEIRDGAEVGYKFDIPANESALDRADALCAQAQCSLYW